MEFKSQSAKKWFDKIAQSKHALWLLFALSFLETIIIPIPIELILIPLMAANRDRIWRLATVTTAGCLVASIVGYAVGMAVYESVGKWFIDAMGYQSAYESYKAFFDSHGFWAVLAVGILPIPFQVAMITAGAAGYSIALFVLAAVIARGLRYYGLAFLVKRYGEKAQSLWQKHAIAVSLGAGALLAAMYFGLKLVSQSIM
ncbi:YqaA family protein [Teredinibacter turnerae]|uniref:YqaA family protein n=1 Tax=Teredinibacter turnerae TaxID=2426 RepID=UPI0030CA72B1